ncbi:hypothetical protein TWF281_002125 [Arthrobotrys megalospora]
MEPSQDLQSSSSSSSSSDGQQPSTSITATPTATRPKREYNSKKRVDAYTAMNKPAYQAVKQAATDSLLHHLNHYQGLEEVWLRDAPKPDNRLNKMGDERPYYWAVVGNMTPTEEKAWKATIGKGRTGPSQTGSRWGTENLHILYGMLKSGRVRPFFGTSDTPSPATCNVVSQGSNILGLGWGLMGDHEDPSKYDEGKYAAKGITLLRELPDAADRMVPGSSGGPGDEDPEGEENESGNIALEN